MSGKSILFLVIGLINVVDIFYKMANCPACNGDFFGFEVSAPVDYGIKILFAYILLSAVYREHQQKKTG